MKPSVIVFSKDRPLQLSLCLSSVYQNLPSNCVSVLYNTSNSQYDKAYNILNFESGHTHFLKQKNFLADLTYLIKRCNGDYVCFLTDDNIVFKAVKEERLKCISDAFDKGFLTFSLRLGFNITERQDGDKFVNEPHPQFTAQDGYISWYLDRMYHSYFAYPFSVDGHIYRKWEILQYIQEIDTVVNNPNHFEEALQRILLPNYTIAAFPHSHVVNSPNNKVQTTHKANRSGDVYPLGVDKLLELFLEGKRLSIDSIYPFPPIKCPHQEIDLLPDLRLGSFFPKFRG